MVYSKTVIIFFIIILFASINGSCQTVQEDKMVDPVEQLLSYTGSCYFDGFLPAKTKVESSPNIVYGKLPIASSYQTQNVIIVTMDGQRICESLLDPTHENIPNIWNKLVPIGTTNLFCQTTVAPASIPGHYSIAIGDREELELDGNDIDSYRARVPTMFECYRKAFNKPETSVFYVSSRDNLTLRTNCSLHPYWGAAYGAVSAYSDSYQSQFQDIYTWQKVSELMDTYHPNIMLINFYAIDQIGHGGDYDKWKETIKRCDGYIYELWNKIQGDPIYSNKTALFITADHGRHDDEHLTGFKDHGGDLCEGCRRVQLIALGPDFKQGVIIKAYQDLIDIAPTTAELLGFNMPYAKGRVMWELFNKITPKGLQKANAAQKSFDPKIAVIRDGYGYHPTIAQVHSPAQHSQGNEQVFYAYLQDDGTPYFDVQLSNNFLLALSPDILASNYILHYIYCGWLPTDGTYTNDRDWQRVFYRRSTDYGCTWSEPVQISDYVLPNFGFWFNKPVLASDAQFLVALFDADTDYIGMNRSYDGGVSWLGFSAIQGGIHPRRPAVGINNNYIHVVCYDLNEMHSDKGNLDIYYYKSQDYGETWTSRYRLTSEPDIYTTKLHRSGFCCTNSLHPESHIHSAFTQLTEQDKESSLEAAAASQQKTDSKTGNAAYTTYTNQISQYNPDIAVLGPNVYVVWMQYESYKKWNVYLVQSTDNGNTFSAPVRLSDGVTDATDPKIIVIGNKVVVSWLRYNTNGDLSIVYIKSNDYGATFSSFQKIPNAPTISLTENYDVTAIGNRVYYCWEEHSSGSSETKITYIEI